MGMTAWKSFGATLSVALLGVLGGGCGGGGAARSSTPPITVPPAADAPWEVRALFAYDPLSLWDVDGEGVRFVTEGMRVRLEGDDVHFAVEHVFDPLECGERVGDGYVFITVDGAIYSAEEFLGPLTLRRPGGARVTSCLVTRGVMVVEEGRNDLLFVGPEGETWRLPDALRGHVVDAAFRDLRHGIVVVPPGVALLTRDNVTYAPIDLGGRSVLSAWPEAERWVVETADGWFAVSDAGEATALAGRPAPTRDTVSDALLDRVLAAAQARQPMAFSGSLPGPDGRLLLHVADDDDDAETVPAQNTVTWSPTRGFETLEAPGEECETRSWGGRALAHCLDAIHVQDDAGGWRQLAGRDDVQLVAAADGSTLATLDACDAEGGRAAQLTCERTLGVYDGQRWRTRTLDQRVTLLDVHGPHVLVEARRTRDLQLLSVDSAGGDRTLSLPGFTRLFLRFDAGGGLFGSAWGTPSDGETPVIPVYAPPGEPLAEVTLPEGAFGFRMADGRHGIALGETLDKVWVTTDGARSWERLTLPGTGDVAGVELPVSRGGSSPALQCGALACRVLDTWVWAAPSVLSSMEHATVVHVPPREGGSGEWLAWRPAAVTAQPVVQCDVPPFEEGAWTPWVQRVTGSLGLDGERLGWAFQEQGRAFEGVSGDLSSAPIGADDLREGVMEPLLLSARFALFDHCTQPRDSEEPDPDLECGALRVVRAGGQPEPLQLPVGDGLPTHFVAAHPLPRGHYATHFIVRRGDRTAYDIVAELDADGTIVGSRVLVFPPHGHVRWLAVRGAVAGLVAGGPGRPELNFHPVDGSAAVAITPPGSAVTRVCSRAGGGVSVVANDAALGPRVETAGEESRFYVPVLRLDGEATCLLGFQARPASTWSDEPSETTPRWLDFELQRGALRVRVIEAERDPSAFGTCSPPTPP
jgi:hypothetical protein